MLTVRFMPIVNASSVLHDDDVRAVIPALQLQYDRDFKPAWGDMVPNIKFSFASAADIPNIDAPAWPIFLNRHSTDPGALGWHTSQGRIFGRIFVADCLAAGISWTTDLTHEGLETALDPSANKTIRMHNGDLAALEACDAVEADLFAYDVTVPGSPPIKCSNFVLPAYFGLESKMVYDFQGVLHGPCPTLSPGGYMSILKAGSNAWSTLQKDHVGGHSGRRFSQGLLRHRRQLRHNMDRTHLKIVY